MKNNYVNYKYHRERETKRREEALERKRQNEWRKWWAIESERQRKLEEKRNNIPSPEEIQRYHERQK